MIWNPNSPKLTWTLGTGSRWPMYKPVLDLIKEYNHVQFRSPSSKTSGVMMIQKLNSLNLIWPWEMRQGYPYVIAFWHLWGTIIVCNLEVLTQKLFKLWSGNQINSSWPVTLETWSRSRWWQMLSWLTSQLI